MHYLGNIGQIGQKKIRQKRDLTNYLWVCPKLSLLPYLVCVHILYIHINQQTCRAPL